MSLQLSSEIANCFPLLLSIGILAACVGLTCSTAWVVWQNVATKSGERITSSNKRHFIALYGLTFATGFFWLGVTALHLLAWQLCLVEETRNQLHLMSYFSTFAVILLGWHYIRSRNTRLVGATRIAIQLAQVSGLMCCANWFPVGTEDSYVQSPPGKLVAIQTARTDSGSPIQLYGRDSTPDELTEFFRATQGHVASVSRFAMFRGEPEPEVNCHGWVFSEQHIVKCEDVPTILKDNGYELVTEPELNDLVVYSGQSGFVVHTGVVCGFLAGEKVLIESKWGVAGRYVHLADEQPYSQDYRFYRSPRDGHKLKYCVPATDGLVKDSHNDSAAPLQSL